VTRTLRKGVALTLCLHTERDCVQHKSLDSAGQQVTALAANVSHAEVILPFLAVLCPKLRRGVIMIVPLYAFIRSESGLGETFFSNPLIEINVLTNF